MVSSFAELALLCQFMLQDYHWPSLIFSLLFGVN